MAPAVHHSRRHKQHRQRHHSGRTHYMRRQRSHQYKHRRQSDPHVCSRTLDTRRRRQLRKARRLPIRQPTSQDACPSMSPLLHSATTARPSSARSETIRAGSTTRSYIPTTTVNGPTPSRQCRWSTPTILSFPRSRRRTCSPKS